MHTKTIIRNSLLSLLVMSLLTATAGPAVAKKEKREPIAKYRAQAINQDRGAAGFIDIVIYEWTTPEEREALIKTFLEKGSKALYEALDDLSEKGYLKAARTLGYDMQYAWKLEVEGKQRIVLATNRPFAFLELARSTRSTDYNVSLVVLEIDPETGQGEGSAVGGAELSLDKEGRLNIEIHGTRPTKLSNLKALPLKKKDE